MYDTHTLKPPPPVSSSYSPSPEPTDDISFLLRQILCKSSSSPSSFSSSSSPFCSPKQMKCEIPPPHSSELKVPALSSGGAPNVPAISVVHVSSSSPGVIGYEADEYDCESEEAFENLMEEMVARPNPPRNPSKRTRAAEVHNISEKRRRSRINEKMKALQKLIPNSSKMDKASILDEAIEYLKQLQLQVQMLTMRNGMNLNSMCGVLQPSHRPSGMNQGKQSINMSTTHEMLEIKPR